MCTISTTYNYKREQKKNNKKTKNQKNKKKKKKNEKQRKPLIVIFEGVVKISGILSESHQRRSSV